MALTNKERLLQQLVQFSPPFLGASSAPLSAMRSPESDLRAELEALSLEAGAIDAYVLDIWDNVWSAPIAGARVMSQQELAHLIHLTAQRSGVSITRGGRLIDLVVADGERHAYLHSYASCYLVLLRFARAFDAIHARRLVLKALPRLEGLTLLLPPDGGPGSSGNEAAVRP